MIGFKFFPRGNGFGGHRAAIGNRHFAIFTRFTQPVTTRYDFGFGGIGKITFRLRQWFGRQAQINRSTVGILQMIK